MLYLILLKKAKNRKPHHARGSGRITTKPKSCWKFIVYFIIILKRQNNPRREKEGEKRVKNGYDKTEEPEREREKTKSGGKKMAKQKTKYKNKRESTILRRPGRGMRVCTYLTHIYILLMYRSLLFFLFLVTKKLPQKHNNNSPFFHTILSAYDALLL